MRFVVALTTAVSAGGRILAVVVAERIVGGDIRSTAMLGIAGIVLFAAGRVLSNGARVDAQCDLQHALTRALVESDVLSAPTPQPLRALFEPTLHARALVTETAPDVVASLIAAVAVAPLVASTLPARALVVSTVALVVVFAALLALGRASVAVQRRVWDASQNVLDQVAFAVEGRLELVARGAEDSAMQSVDRSIETYRKTAKRGAWASAMLGRAPLAAGLAAVVLAVVLDASNREAVASAVLKQALVLTACLPILLGVVMRANDVVRLSAMVTPVLDVLAAPRRAELTRKGSPPPALPAAVAVRNLAFAYGDDSAPTLRDLTFDWPVGGALVVEGPNGSGKSTLLRILLGLRSPHEGSVSIGGSVLTDVDLPLLRRKIAYLPQRPYLGEHYTTVRSALLVVSDGASDGALRSALSRVGLGSATRTGDVLDALVGELSAGQRQRLALGRVLLQDASIYLLDEPDANLDRAGIALVAEIVRGLVQGGRMVAIAAHTDELAALAGTSVTLT
jgi:ABC-type multidrug transport system fused ATPase/permease subunit